MNRLKPLTPATRIQFEQAARALGHRNFDMRSKDHYCVTELNTLAKGFCMAFVSSVHGEDMIVLRENRG